MTKASNIHIHPANRLNTETPTEPTRLPLALATTPQPLQPGSVLDERLGEELHAMRRWIEGVVFSIGADPILQRRHSADLATLKRMAETAGALASVAAAADRAEAVDRLRISELKARLQRKRLRGLFEVKH